MDEFSINHGALVAHLHPMYGLLTPVPYQTPPFCLVGWPGWQAIVVPNRESRGALE
jgi:hypothetical protein